jgi:hypothetical protein
MSQRSTISTQASTLALSRDHVAEPRIFEGRVLMPEEQEQMYEEIIKIERMEYVSPPKCAS